MSLGREIKKSKPFDSLEQEAMLNLARTWDVLSGEMSLAVFKPAGLSPAQYNVLRILRGAGAGAGAGEHLACGEIAERMIAREPDMTRLLDRLEKRNLVSRCRQQTDRRVVAVRITDAGLNLLAELDPKITAAHRAQLAHLSERELKQLIALLEKARAREARAENCEPSASD
jgi:DNA-binding MarR family transcriptional regulator